MDNNQKKSNNCWAMFAMFLLGVIVGFMFAPIKNGFRICCDNNDSMNAYSGGKSCECIDEDDDSSDEGIPF